MEIRQRVNCQHAMGSGPNYHWALCSYCNRWFDSRFDPGFWGERTIACKDCLITQGLSSLPHPSRRPPPAALHVPERYLQASLRDFPSRIETVAKRWGKKLPFVGIYGCSGAGKTRLAYAMTMFLRDQGTRPIFLHAQSARSEWIGSLNRERLEQVWMETHALVIDDFTRGPSDGWLDVLMNIIDHRTNEYLPTLVTCMESGQEVTRVLGAAFARRLQYFEWIHLDRIFSDKATDDSS